MQIKVKRKLFLTSCSTSPKTKKKQKLQELLSPRPLFSLLDKLIHAHTKRRKTLLLAEPARCVSHDDPVRRNLDCEFFHVGDEENMEDQ